MMNTVISPKNQKRSVPYISLPYHKHLNYFLEFHRHLSIGFFSYA